MLCACFAELLSKAIIHCFIEMAGIRPSTNSALVNVLYTSYVCINAVVPGTAGVTLSLSIWHQLIDSSAANVACYSTLLIVCTLLTMESAFCVSFLLSGFWLQMRFSYSPNNQMAFAYSPNKQMRFAYSSNK